MLPPTLHLTLERAGVLRYGENPHQRGARYRTAGTASWWDDAQQHGGKELSYLNLFDGDAAWRLVHELSGDAGRPAVAIIKHANPCGAAVAADLVTAYERALECDVQSAFGGVVAVGGAVSRELADAIAAGPQADVIIAASYEPGALETLTTRRKATRILSGPAPERALRQLRSLGAGVLVQEIDEFASPPTAWEVVTTRPTDRRGVVATWSWPGGCAAAPRPMPSPSSTTGRPWGSGPASSHGWWRRRSPCARPGNGPRGVPGRATPSSRSPTGCWSWPPRGSRRWCSRADRCGTPR